MASIFFEKLAEARTVVKNYSSEQITLVQECLKEEANIISEYFFDEREIEVGPKLSECRYDFVEQAIEDDLLTEEEFDDLYDALEVFGTMDAMAVA